MHPLHHWLGATKAQRQSAISQLFLEKWSSKNDYIRLVKVPGNWGVFASVGPHYHYAIFGRDSIEAAEDLLTTHKELVQDIILVLCRLQGVIQDRMSEEEPGKIHHEYRAMYLNGFKIPDYSEQILRQIQRERSMQGSDEMTYYGSFDATPLFVRLIGLYAAKYGDGILSETFRAKNGHVRTVRDGMLAALEWLTEKLMSHPLGLLAYRRMNPDGIANQIWKDSATSHLHSDGSLPNFGQPIASAELQGFAYDALRTGVMFNIGTRKLQQKWQDLALHVQRQTIATLWMDDNQYFAQGIDFDDRFQHRQIATITSDPGALLDSRLLNDLPESHARRYIHAVARMIFSPELLTDVGIRCRAIRHWELLNFIDYHGSNTVWPKETFDIAQGLRRAGLRYLAADLERRLAIGIEQAGEFSEFFYVSRNGTVRYDPNEIQSHFGAESPGHFIAIPEPGQAWTISAAIRIAYTRSLHKVPRTPPTSFEQTILSAK